MADRLSLLVNSVADALSKEESSTLLYLCSDLMPRSDRVEDFRRALLSLATHMHTDTGQSQPADNILKELVFRLRRFDILKKILGTSKQEMEERLRDGCILSKYRVLMMELGENLDGEEVDSLIFLISNTVPKGTLDRVTNFLDIIVELEKLDEVSCENLGLVEQCLINIRRADLAKKIQQFQKGQHGHVSQNPVQVATQEAGGGYNINSEVRGFCVIIDCIGCDGVLLKDTFEQLGFQVVLHTMLAVEEVHSVLRTISQHRGLQRAAAFTCFLLSRASDSHLLATDPSGPGLLLTSLLQLFHPLHCPVLRGKPKLFFTQSYVVAENQSGQGQNYEHLETDSEPFGGVLRQSGVCEDVLWSMCKTGAWLLERPGHQSVYLHALSTALLQARTRKLHILDALIEVNSNLREHNLKNPDKTYMITLSHTLQNNLYL